VIKDAEALGPMKMVTFKHIQQQKIANRNLLLPDAGREKKRRPVAIIWEPKNYCRIERKMT
jgi:hypothetical protein